MCPNTPMGPICTCYSWRISLRSHRRVDVRRSAAVVESHSRSWLVGIYWHFMATKLISSRRSHKRRSDRIVYHCAGFSTHPHFTVVSSLTSMTTAALVFSATLHSVTNTICSILGLSSWPVIQTRGFQNAGDHRQRDGVSQFVTWQTEGHQQQSDQSKKIVFCSEKWAETLFQASTWERR